MLLTQTIKQPRNSTSMHKVRLLTLTLLAGTSLMATHSTAMAQAYPEQPVKLVVPFPAGGTTDVLARALGQQLAEKIGQPVIIENKPGAGATIGAEYVARSKPDGYTLLMGAVHHTIATTFYSSLRYDFQKDFAPVTTVAMVPNVLVVNNKVGVKSVADLIALAKREPGKLSFGSNGVGTGQHLIGERVQLMPGIKLLHVPYKQGQMTDVINGQVAMVIEPFPSGIPMAKSGRVKALAVTGEKRIAELPNVPAMNEAVRGLNLLGWQGIWTTAGTPPEVITRLNREINKALGTQAVQERIAALGGIPAPMSPADFNSRSAIDSARFGALIKARNIQSD